MNMFLSQEAGTHCHFEVGKLLGVDNSFVNRVRLRQVDQFAEREQGEVGD